MAYKVLPDAEYLRNVLLYNEQTGELIWKSRPRTHFKTQSAFVRWNKLHANTPAFKCSEKTGYRSGMLDGVSYYAHRIIWAIAHGPIPSGEIDHINGIRYDNRLINLRLVTRLENTQNRKVRSDSKTGVPGVYWEKACNKWRAEIKANKKRISLGVFDILEDAIAARKDAERRYGFHPNHGRGSST